MADSERGNALWLKQADEWMKRGYPLRSLFEDLTDCAPSIRSQHGTHGSQHRRTRLISFSIRSLPQEQHLWRLPLRDIRYLSARVTGTAMRAHLLLDLSQLDSLKSRLQSTREPISLPRLAADVIREEGIAGLWRGFPLPLITIAAVRSISFTIYTSTKRFVNNGAPFSRQDGFIGLDGEERIASGQSTITSQLQQAYQKGSGLGLFSTPSITNVALTSSIAGAASGAVVSIGSCPFELVKVRRQLEYQIARDRLERAERMRLLAMGKKFDPLKHAGKDLMADYKPPGTWPAVKDIYREKGITGLWAGFRLHSGKSPV